MENKINLPPEHLLKLNDVVYKIIEFLGHGGSSTVYRAESPDGFVIIKEVFPKNLVDRITRPSFDDEDMTLDIPDDCKASMDTYKNRARLEFKHACKLRLRLSDGTEDNRIAKYKEPFECNNTSYTVIENSYRGKMLSTMMWEENSLANFPDFIDVCDQILRILKALNPLHNHENGAHLHRDISPDNVFVFDDIDNGERLTHLIDFNSVYEIGSEESDHLFSIKEAYSPPELDPSSVCYSQKLTQATDLYSVAVIFFELLMGRVPEPQDYLLWAHGRMVVDDSCKYADSLAEATKKEVNEVLKKGLRIVADKRYEDIGKMYEAIKALQNTHYREQHGKKFDKRAPKIMENLKAEFLEMLDAPAGIKHSRRLEQNEFVSSDSDSRTSEVLIPNEIYYTRPTSGRIIVLSGRNAKLKSKHDARSKIDFGKTDEFPDKMEDIVRHKLIDKIQEVVADSNSKIVILYGSKGVGKSRIIRQFLIKHRSKYKDFCFVSLNNIVDSRDFDSGNLFERILTGVPLVSSEIQQNRTLDAERKAKLKEIKKMDADDILIVDCAQNITPSFVETILQQNFNCKVILLTVEPCDFINDYSDGVRVPLAFDPENDFEEMNSIFDSEIRNDTIKGTLTIEERKILFTELEYNTHIVVQVARLLNASENVKEIITSIKNRNISKISEKTNDKKTMVFKSLFEYISDLLPDIGDANELKTLLLISLLNRGEPTIATLCEHYSISKYTLLSLHNKGIIAFDKKTETVSISSVLMQVYYEKFRLADKSVVSEILEVVAKGLISEFILPNCKTFSDVLLNLESIHFALSRIYAILNSDDEIYEPAKALICLFKSDMLSVDTELNFGINMAELYNALGNKDEAYHILQTIKIRNIKFLSDNKELYLKVLNSKLNLSRLLYSMDQVADAISQLQDILVHLDEMKDDVNYQFKGLVYNALMRLYTTSGDIKTYLDIAEKAINVYIQKGEYFGAIYILQQILLGPSVPSKRYTQLYKKTKKHIDSMDKNNAVELIMLLALNNHKKLSEEDCINSPVTNDYLMTMYLKQGLIGAVIKAYFPLKRMEYKIDKEDRSGDFIRYSMGNKDLTPQETTQAIWDLFDGIQCRYKKINIPVAIASQFQDFVKTLERYFDGVIKIDEVLANELILSQLRRELQSYQSVLLLTNIDAVRMQGELYKYFVSALGIGEAINFLNNYAANIEVIPINYVANRAEALENLGDLYKTVAKAKTDESIDVTSKKTRLGVVAMRDSLHQKANRCYYEASKIVPKTNLARWAKIMYKARQYQEVYNELKVRKVFSCTYCECCYNLALRAADNGDVAGYKKYFKEITITSSMVLVCRRTECYVDKLKELRRLYLATKSDNAKEPFFLKITGRFINRFESNKMTSGVDINDKKAVDKYINKAKRQLGKTLRTFNLSDKQKNTDIYHFAELYYQYFDISNETTIKSFLKYFRKNFRNKYEFLCQYFECKWLSESDLKGLIDDALRELFGKYSAKSSDFIKMNTFFIRSLLEKEKGDLPWSSSKLLHRINMNALHELLFSDVKMSFLNNSSTISKHYNDFSRLKFNLIHLLKDNAICEAEDYLFESLEKQVYHTYSFVIEMFYDYLDTLNDKTLFDANFSRLEIAEGREYALKVLFFNELIEKLTLKIENTVSVVCGNEYSPNEKASAINDMIVEIKTHINNDSTLLSTKIVSLVLEFADKCKRERLYSDAENMLAMLFETYEVRLQEKPAYIQYLKEISNRLSSIYEQTYRLEDAENVTLRMIEITKFLPSTTQDIYIKDLVDLNYKFANIYSNSIQIEQRYKNIVNILDEATTEGSEYISLLAKGYCDYAKFCVNDNQPEKAVNMFKKSLELWMPLFEENQSAYEESYDNCLFDLAYSLHHDVYLLKMSESIFNETAEIYYKLIQLRERLAIEKPNEYDGALAVAINSFGSLCRSATKYEQAEQLYRRALSIREKILCENPNCPTAKNDLAKQLYRFGLLYDLTNDITMLINVWLRAEKIWLDIDLEQYQQSFEFYIKINKRLLELHNEEISTSDDAVLLEKYSFPFLLSDASISIKENEFAVLRRQDVVFLSDQGNTLKQLDNILELSKPDVVKSILSILKQFGCTKYGTEIIIEVNNWDSVIDKGENADITKAKMVLYSCVSFMLNMELFYLNDEPLEDIIHNMNFISNDADESENSDINVRIIETYRLPNINNNVPEFALMSKADGVYLSDLGKTLEELHNEFELNEFDVKKNLVAIMNKYGVVKQKNEFVVKIDKWNGNTNEELNEELKKAKLMLFNCVSFMLNMRIFYT